MTRCCWALSLALALAAANPARAATYDCTPLQVLDVIQPSGKTAPDSLQELRLKQKWRIDVPRNSVGAEMQVQAGGNTWRYAIQQVGTSENDLVGLRVFVGLASTPVYLIRIRMRNNPVVFAALESDVLTTGLCRPIE